MTLQVSFTRQPKKIYGKEAIRRYVKRYKPFKEDIDVVFLPYECAATAVHKKAKEQKQNGEKKSRKPRNVKREDWNDLIEAGNSDNHIIIFDCSDGYEIERLVVFHEFGHLVEYCEATTVDRMVEVEMKAHTWAIKYAVEKKMYRVASELLADIFKWYISEDEVYQIAGEKMLANLLNIK